jgi:hypothetical protein
MAEVDCSDWVYKKITDSGIGERVRLKNLMVISYSGTRSWIVREEWYK